MGRGGVAAFAGGEAGGGFGAAIGWLDAGVNVVDTGGSGPPLVFIHGWSANWQSWLLNIAAFMRTHRCVALDLPGFGQSAMPSEPISIQGYAATVDGVCDALGIDSVSVIGNALRLRRLKL